MALTPHSLGSVRDCVAHWPPPAPQPAEDDLDLDREVGYTFDTDEPMLGRPPAGDVE